LLGVYDLCWCRLEIITRSTFNSRRTLENALLPTRNLTVDGTTACVYVHDACVDNSKERALRQRPKNRRCRMARYLLFVHLKYFFTGEICRQTIAEICCDKSPKYNALKYNLKIVKYDFETNWNIWNGEMYVYFSDRMIKW